jgi:hypothetical protein
MTAENVSPGQVSEGNAAFYASICKEGGIAKQSSGSGIQVVRLAIGKMLRVEYAETMPPETPNCSARSGLVNKPYACVQ